MYSATVLQAALGVVARMLHAQPRGFGFAGTKDKRGVTTQWVTAFKVAPAKLAALNPRYASDCCGGCCCCCRQCCMIRKCVTCYCLHLHLRRSSCVETNICCIQYLTAAVITGYLRFMLQVSHMLAFVPLCGCILPAGGIQLGCVSTAANSCSLHVVVCLTSALVAVVRMHAAGCAVSSLATLSLRAATSHWAS
jgi:hypothetical protein